MRRTLDELQEPGVVAAELVPVPEQILALRRSQNPPLGLEDHRQYVLCVVTQSRSVPSGRPDPTDVATT